jgi:hypothetical protein
MAHQVQAPIDGRLAGTIADRLLLLGEVWNSDPLRDSGGLGESIQLRVRDHYGSHNQERRIASDLIPNLSLEALIEISDMSHHPHSPDRTSVASSRRTILIVLTIVKFVRLDWN